MRDWSIELNEWIWVAVDGTPPPQAALKSMELVETEPGVNAPKRTNDHREGAGASGGGEAPRARNWLARRLQTIT
jgi:hypothetical protein